MLGTFRVMQCRISSGFMTGHLQVIVSYGLYKWFNSQEPLLFSSVKTLVRQYICKPHGNEEQEMGTFPEDPFLED